MAINADILIEDMIEAYPDAVGFLIREGLPCVVCGEPFWGTLAELAKEKGWDTDRVEALVAKFNAEHA